MSDAMPDTMSDTSPTPDLAPAPQAPLGSTTKSPVDPTIAADDEQPANPAGQAPGPGIDPATP